MWGMDSSSPISAPRMIREWLYAGPFGTDVTHLYSTNYDFPLPPYHPLIDEAVAALGTLRPAEGEPVKFRGEQIPWKYARIEPTETKIVWTTSSLQHALMATTFAYTRLVVEHAGRYEFPLHHGGSCAISVNGVPAYEFRGITGGREASVVLDLREGVNDLVVMVLSVQLNRIANTLRLLAPDGITDTAPLLLEGAEREALEADLRGFYLADPVLAAGSSVDIYWDRPLASPGEFIFHLGLGYNAGLIPVRDRVAALEGSPAPFSLVEAGELPFDGGYSLQIDYRSPSGVEVSGVTLHLERIGFLPPLPEGTDSTYAQRCRHLLIHTAAKLDEEMPVPPQRIFRELARVSAGLPTDEAAIRASVAFINRRSDCADFALHGLLRMYIQYRDTPALSPELAAEIKECILGFRYAMDEPGPSMMYMLSENHRILFHSLEHIVGLLFPTEMFTNSGQNGLFHALKGRLDCEAWIREKGTYGFEEWYSNTYFEEDILALLTLHDFGMISSRVKVLAGKLLDFLCGLIATHTLEGVFGTTHGRSYQDSTLYPELEGMGRIHWLLFGLPHRPTSRLAIGSVALATSGYQPHQGWEAVAASQEPLLTLSRMGLFTYHDEGGVNISTYRTRNYMVSGLVESLAGRRQHPQAQAGQVLLAGNVPLFTTSFETRSPNATPSYWGGQYRMPKVIAHRGLLAFIYKIDSSIGLSHCYFPAARFDEVVERGPWLFGRKGEAFVAVYSLRPYQRPSEGEWRGRELLCLEKHNIWLLEAGNTDECGSFENFITRIAAASLTPQGDDLDYASPFHGRFELGFDRHCTRDGDPVISRSYPLIESPHLKSEYGEGEVHLTAPGRKWTLNFMA